METLAIVEKLTNLTRSRRNPDISYFRVLFADYCGSTSIANQIKSCEPVCTGGPVSHSHIVVSSSLKRGLRRNDREEYV